jgi:uncharacterized membrane protein (UPF0127 family)
VDVNGKLLMNLTRGTVVCDQLVVADHMLDRMRGLLGRSSLSAGEGLLLRPAPSIHTAFMSFSIDAVFLDRNMQVIKVIQNLGPWRAASAARGRAVLELGAGGARERGIAVGDELGLVEINGDVATLQSKREASGPNRLDPTEGTSRDRARVAAASDDDGLAPGAEAHAPPRVLLVGTDRRFRAVAAMLLARRGYAVSVAERLSNAAELARRDRADVVVLDGSGSLAAAADQAAAIEEVDPTTGVVVVAELPDRGLLDLSLVAKWGSFDGLYGAIENARPTRSRRGLNGRGNDD